jgi:RNA-binding protein
MITDKMRLRIRRRLSSEKPAIWIGKSGATREVIEEVSRQLEEREMVKIKILRSALKNEVAKSIASEVADRTAATLIDVRGHTVLLHKQRKRRH